MTWTLIPRIEVRGRPISVSREYVSLPVVRIEVFREVVGFVSLSVVLEPVLTEGLLETSQVFPVIHHRGLGYFS
jgi:hypothetical protein